MKINLKLGVVLGLSVVIFAFVLSGCEKKDSDTALTGDKNTNLEFGDVGVGIFIDDGTGHHIMSGTLTNSIYQVKLMSKSDYELECDFYLIVDGVIQESIWKGKMPPYGEQYVEMNLENLIGGNQDEHSVHICLDYFTPLVYPLNDTMFLLAGPLNRTYYVEDTKVTKTIEYAFDTFEDGGEYNQYFENPGALFRHGNDDEKAIFKNDNIKLEINANAGDYLYMVYADGKRVKSGYVHFDEQKCKTLDLTEELKGTRLIWAKFVDLSDPEKSFYGSQKYMLTD